MQLFVVDGKSLKKKQPFFWGGSTKTGPLEQVGGKDMSQQETGVVMRQLNLILYSLKTRSGAKYSILALAFL